MGALKNIYGPKGDAAMPVGADYDMDAPAKDWENELPLSAIREYFEGYLKLLTEGGVDADGKEVRPMKLDILEKGEKGVQFNPPMRHFEMNYRLMHQHNTRLVKTDFTLIINAIRLPDTKMPDGPKKIEEGHKKLKGG